MKGVNRFSFKRSIQKYTLFSFLYVTFFLFVVLHLATEIRKKIKSVRENQDFIASSISQGENEIEPKYILYWNEAYGNKEYGFCCGKQPFKDFKCKVQNCVATSNRSELSDVSKFDAILFHQRGLEKQDLPQTRASSQRYIMFSLESPQYPFDFVSEDWNGFFNWTLTYRRDSDFPMLYGKLEKIKEHPSDQKELDKLIHKFGKSHRHLVAKKENKVAWFVSNCQTMSLREKYVTALQNHGIKVDIYGGCGGFKCLRQNDDACWEMVEQKYKFYLSFENSICTDYLTEKFFNAMSHHIVPITLGGANYSAVSPYHSALHVYHELENPAELARLLKDLFKNDHKYAEYFWWKDFYRVVRGPEERAQAFCDICRKLHEQTKPHVYQDLEKWWEQKAKCRPLRIKGLLRAV